MNQSQHTIQKSWLKQFQSTKGKAKGKVEVVSKNTLASKLLSSKKIACEVDFQSADNEQLDNDLIESPAITVLHRLKKGLSKLSGDEIVTVQKWVALHLTRSRRSREDLENLPVAYDRARLNFFNDDYDYVRSFGLVWVYVADRQDEPLILSDNPVLLMSDRSILCPFSPGTIVGSSKRVPRSVMNDGRSLSEVANEMSFSNATEEVYGNPDLNSPWSKIREHAARNVLDEERVSPVRVK